MKPLMIEPRGGYVPSRGSVPSQAGAASRGVAPSQGSVPSRAYGCPSWEGVWDVSPTLEIQNGTAIVPVYGFLTKRPCGLFDGGATTAYETLHAQIQAALDDPLVERIVLDIDSPGGEVNGLFNLCDFVYAARSQKPIEAIANDDAFSAAYALASSAQKVWCTRTSGLGSIGVIATHYDQSQFDQKAGLTITPIFAGQHKNDLSPHAPLSEDAKDSTQAEMDRLYGLLVTMIARNCGISQAAVRATEAALFFGSEAIDQHLADGLATLKGLLTPPPVQTSVPCLTPERSISMETIPEPISMGTQSLPEASPQAPVPTESLTQTRVSPEPSPQEVPPPTEAAQASGLQTADSRVADSRVADLVTLCKIAHRPELLVQWLDRNMTVAEAQASLLQEMENQPAIASHHAPIRAPENPLIQAAKNRAH